MHFNLLVKFSNHSSQLRRQSLLLSQATSFSILNDIKGFCFSHCCSLYQYINGPVMHQQSISDWCLHLCTKQIPSLCSWSYRVSQKVEVFSGSNKSRYESNPDHWFSIWSSLSLLMDYFHFLMYCSCFSSWKTCNSIYLRTLTLHWLLLPTATRCPIIQFSDLHHCITPTVQSFGGNWKIRLSFNAVIEVLQLSLCSFQFTRTCHYLVIVSSTLLLPSEMVRLH
jgi:hypothetical protein